ncbi:hypothetical protein HDU81_006011 [Chytriomyces hyalinus]|nr:hypothetical protein HDU81_006011 [Chytriomyces hyalinus]
METLVLHWFNFKAHERLLPECHTQLPLKAAASLQHKQKDPRKTMHATTLFVAALAAASTVTAHFELVAPPSRLIGTMMTQKVGPCGTANTPSTVRTDFATLDNSIGLVFYWDGDNDVFIGFGENPTEFPYKVGGIKSVGGETYKVPLDFSSVPKDVLAKGGPATIQVVCHQPKEVNLYQCGDVTIAPAVVPVSLSPSTVDAVSTASDDAVTASSSSAGVAASSTTSVAPVSTASKSASASVSLSASVSPSKATETQKIYGNDGTAVVANMIVAAGVLALF